MMIIKSLQISSSFLLFCLYVHAIYSHKFWKTDPSKTIKNFKKGRCQFLQKHYKRIEKQAKLNKQTNKQNTKTKQTNKTSKVSVIVIVSLAYLQISWCTNARSHLNIKRTVSSEDILCW